MISPGLGLLRPDDSGDTPSGSAPSPFDAVPATLTFTGYARRNESAPGSKHRYYSTPGTSRAAGQWLAGGYGPTGTPNTVGGDGDSARYTNNLPLQFWPTRDATQSASVVGGVLPTGATACTPFQYNRGRCVATADRGDPIAKLRLRPVYTTLDHSSGKQWGWISIFENPSASPGDIIGNMNNYDVGFTVRQNLPCINGPGGFIADCLPCETPGAVAGSCSVLVDDLPNKTLLNTMTDVQRRVLETFPCPMASLALRLGEARVPYNLMTAVPDKGGARDTPDANFYTCEYRSNAIQGLDELRAFVDGFMSGDVAPCCAAANASARSGSTSANPCWHVAHDADVPFQRGVPDDFAAGFLLNYAARVRMTDPGRLCSEAQNALLSQINRAKGNAAIDSYPNVNRALDILAEAVRSIDGTRKDCAVAEGRSARLNPDGTITWTQGRLWGPWGDLAGQPGACSVMQTTENRRLECGTGLQMRSLTVTQQPHCGGDACPPLTQYRFCQQNCAKLFGAPPGRAGCLSACNAARDRNYAQCLSAYGTRADAQCRGLAEAELASCQDRCTFNHPDYACSSNLCLTPGRCDPITNRCGP
jgi:hypothetical protein